MKRLPISIVIPVYNESKRLGPYLRSIFTYAKREHLQYEVIVSDDGCTDDTVVVARKVAKEFSFAVLRIVGGKPNRGKGHAVKIGMQQARYDVGLFCDADGSTPITELEHFWKPLETHEVVIGSRRTRGAVISKRQSIVKELLGRAGNRVIQWLTVPGIQDTQCGFKVFRGTAMKLFDKQTIDRWGFDVELLLMARIAHLRIAQVPVTWKNDEQSKVHWMDYPKFLIEVFRIRGNQLRGRYAAVNNLKSGA